MFDPLVRTELLPSASLTGATTLTAADSGRVYELNLAGGFTVTLPALVAGATMHFRFVVGTNPTTAYIIATNSADADKIFGHVTASTGGDEDSETSGGADQVNFVANTALISDYVDIFSNPAGTRWYAYGRCDATGAITLTG